MYFIHYEPCYIHLWKNEFLEFSFHRWVHLLFSYFLNF